MTRLSVAAALFLTLVANAAQADVEKKKFSYRGQDAYATFLIPTEDGCTVARSTCSPTTSGSGSPVTR